MNGYGIFSVQNPLSGTSKGCVSPFEELVLDRIDLSIQHVIFPYSLMEAPAATEILEEAPTLKTRAISCNG